MEDWLDFNNCDHYEQVGFWLGPYTYQMLVFTCRSIPQFMNLRTSLLMTLGKGPVFWKTLFMVTRDIIGCMRPLEEESKIRSQQRACEALLSLNYPPYQSLLLKVPWGKHHFVKSSKVNQTTQT